ncbi:MAG: hypothetical protein ACRD3E_04645 [Terriglobales bacterium]
MALMNCNEFRDHVLDAVSDGAPAEARAHADACAGCAAEVHSLRATMNLLDEWTAPADASPYFMTRLRARMHEEKAAPARSWLQWFRNPALAVAMMLLMVLSVSLFRSGSSDSEPAAQHTDLAKLAKPGTAVGDLMDLDKNHDILNDFDLLDDLDQTSN